jgi:hypothetical protein
MSAVWQEQGNVATDVTAAEAVGTAGKLGRRVAGPFGMGAVLCVQVADDPGGQDVGGQARGEGQDLVAQAGITSVLPSPRVS